jgi:hypothetical protein
MSITTRKTNLVNLLKSQSRKEKYSSAAQQQQEQNISNKNAAKQGKKIGNNADLIKLAALRHSTASKN